VKVPFVNLTRQYAQLKEAIDGAITSVLARGAFILGEEVEQLEKAFADYCETGYAVGVDTGTSALELALRAYGIGEGDEVITAANTFVATAAAITFAGARPVLVDIDPETCTIDPDAAARAVTPRTKALMPVHLYGHPADMDALLAVARQHDLRVIEDACQAHGARHRGRRVGSLGDAAAFSFYPAKNLGAAGDGGMLVTRDAAVAEKVRMLRNYGQTEKYHHDFPGYNRRLDTLQAAVLGVKLPHLDAWNEARRRVAAVYNERLAGCAGWLRLPVERPEMTHVYHLYVVHTSRRDALQKHLGSCDVSTGIHYPIPVHLQAAYADLGGREGDFPLSESSAREVLSLPMFPEMTEAEAARVAEAVSAFPDA
jgi:dTDP-4-amino-4,6-dideoxygalactose transaminase